MSLKKALTLSALLLSSPLFAAGEVGNVLRAFEDKPGYVKPLATVFGTLMNTGWVNSARVGYGTGWGFGLPIMVAYVGTEDHTYDYTYSTGCADLRARGQVGSDCPASNDEITIKDAPTIWGPNSNAQTYQYLPTIQQVGDSDPSDNYQKFSSGTIDGGESTLRKITTLPFLAPQFSFSSHNFRGTLRGMLLPISPISFYSFGLGLQYDPTRFLPPVVAEKGFNTSVAFSVSKWHVGYTPGDDFDGTLNIDGLTTFTALVAGWRYDIMEVFTEIGYETSSFASGGNLTDNGPDVAEADRKISPKVDVDGRNGFRMSLNFAIHLGSWQPVVGQSYGAQFGTAANVIQFGKEGNQ